MSFLPSIVNTHVLCDPVRVKKSCRSRRDILCDAHDFVPKCVSENPSTIKRDFKLVSDFRVIVHLISMNAVRYFSVQVTA